MRVAAAQFCPLLKNYEANLSWMMRLTVRAAKEGAQLVVLPELATCGYSFLYDEEARPFAESAEEGRTVRTMTSLCSNFDVHVAYGFMELDAEGKLYNCQALVGPQGLLASCRKLNQWGNDWLWATAGTASPPVVRVGDKRVGLLICRDVRDKSDSLSDLYEPGDADVVAFSSNFGDGAFPSGSWMKFAKKNRVHFIVSNRYGKEENNDFGEGGICIISPDGRVQCRGLEWSKPCIVHGEV
jgi:predicted amidohydrolase